MITTEKGTYPKVTLFIRTVGVFEIFISLLGLARWVFETPAMQGSLPTNPAAKVNGLICGLCFGIILLLTTKPGAKAQWAFKVLTGFAILLSAASLSQDIFDINLGIDEFFIKDSRTSYHPGRMAMFASAGFTIVGLAMLGQTVKNNVLKLTAKAMLNAVSLFCFFILITYVYQVTRAHQMYASFIMSLPACFVLMLTSAAACMRQPDTGLPSFFFGDKLGSQIARLLFPLLVLTILALGFGQVLLSRYEGVNEYFGIALLLFSFILTCLAIVVFVSHRFNKLDEERNATMLQLQMQNEELKQFAYITSHDLQEPLRTIQGYARFLAKEPATDRSKLFLAGINESTGKMSTLINGLLHYNLLGTKKDYEPVAMDAVWNDVLQDVSTGTREAKALITATTPLPVVSGSGKELRQLLQNLVSNGLKFRNTQVQPRIELSVKEQKGEWLFAVKDNGIGIPAKYREKVFQLFQRLHGAEEYDGYGIGLSYCKKIVELHKGKIWIEGADEGGSIFCFTIAKDIKNVSYA